jgi:DNA polymerase-3 subunit alpha
MGGRGVVRDVSRVFDIPIAEVNTVCKSIVPKLIGDADRDQSVSEAFSETEDGKNFCEKYPDVSEYAARMEGTVRGRGQHAAGTIISADSLYDSDKCYIIKGKDDHPLVNWDKKEIEAMGLMKLDVLGLSALTILSDILERIRFGRGKTIKLEDITFDDPKVFDGFTKGNSVGCFQFGSSSFRKYCGELIVDDFNTIVHATSLWRPGPLQSGQAFEVIEYKHKRKRIPRRHPILREITKTSYGILLYQEQIMQVVNQLAGLSWEVADEVRKAIAKSQGAEKLMTFRDTFVAGCLKMETLDEDEAIALWDQIVSFGKYGFNLSHAVEYSVISYWDMYFKVNYPLEFYAASLTFCGNDTKDNLVQDAMKNGIDVRPPKIGISGFDKWVIFEDRLYCPFSEIFGIGPKTAEALQKFKIESREDVKKRLPRFAKIFEECRCYDDVAITDEEAEQIGNYFQFSFSQRSREVQTA